MALNWAPLIIWYTHYAIGLVNRISTSSPCHLTCFYTEKEPWTHRQSRTIRGLTVPWGSYFCFVAWSEVEQAEAGDTLYHTFHFPAWLIGEQKWFTFKGTVTALASPSVGPIFQHTHPGADPPLPILRPIAQGDYAACEPSPATPNHWQNVDDVIPDGDATYMVAPAIAFLPAQPEAYIVDTLPPDSINIDKVIVRGRFRRAAQNPAGTYPATFQIGLRINGTTYRLQFQSASNVYFQFSRSYATNPDTALPWTVADLATVQAYIALDFYNRALHEGGLIRARCTQVYIEVIEGIKGGP